MHIDYTPTLRNALEPEEQLLLGILWIIATILAVLFIPALFLFGQDEKMYIIVACHAILIAICSITLNRLDWYLTSSVKHSYIFAGIWCFNAALWICKTVSHLPH